jgi:hypothetical protein
MSEAETVEYTNADSSEVEPGFNPQPFTQQKGADASPDAEVDKVEPDGKPDEAKAAEESEGESPPPVEENDEKTTSSFKERIQGLNTQFRESERRAEAETDRANSAEQRITELQDQIAHPAEKPKTLADFEYDEAAYRQYIIEDTRKIAREEAQGVAREYGQRTEERAATSEYDKRADTFSATVEDFDKVVKSDDLRISQPMAEVIKHVDVGPEVAYYLGKNPDESAELSRLPPALAGMAMSEVVERIRSEKAKSSEKSVSKAPPPPAKIKGADAGIKVASTDPKSDKMSDAEWQKAEDVREAKLRG